MRFKKLRFEFDRRKRLSKVPTPSFIVYFALFQIIRFVYRLHAHKAVFFHSFPGVLKNSTLQPNELKFEALSGGALRKLINFSYEGFIDSFTDEAELIEIASFAIEFNVDDLSKYCDRFYPQITLDNCFELLFKYPDDSTLNHIQRICVDLMIDNFLTVFQRPEFIKISVTVFERMLRNKKMTATEIDIFLAFLKWYYKNPNFEFTLGTQNSPDHKRNVKRILDLIRFPLIPVDVSIFYFVYGSR